MAITARQFTQLSEMGITVWQQKAAAQNELCNEHPAPNTQASTAQINTVETSTVSAAKKHSPAEIVQISIEQLAEHQFFQDLLVSLGLTLGEIKVTTKHINLGFINWQMLSTPTESNSESPVKISFKNGLLTTPPMTEIQQSPALKRQLWSIIQTSS